MSKRNKRATPVTSRPFRIDQTHERLIQQFVAAQITTREHAERVIARGERSVIEAWYRRLAQPALAHAGIESQEAQQ